MFQHCLGKERVGQQSATGELLELTRLAMLRNTVGDFMGRNEKEQVLPGNLTRQTYCQVRVCRLGIDDKRAASTVVYRRGNRPGFKPCTGRTKQALNRGICLRLTHGQDFKLHIRHVQISQHIGCNT